MGKPFYTEIDIGEGVTKLFIEDKNNAHQLALLMDNPKVKPETVSKAEQYLKNMHEKGGLRKDHQENIKLINSFISNYPDAFQTWADDQGRIYHLTKKIPKNRSQDVSSSEELDPNIVFLLTANGFATIRSIAHNNSPAALKELDKFRTVIKYANLTSIIDTLVEFGPSINEKLKLELSSESLDLMPGVTSIEANVKEIDIEQMQDSDLSDYFKIRLKTLDKIYEELRAKTTSSE